MAKGGKKKKGSRHGGDSSEDDERPPTRDGGSPTEPPTTAKTKEPKDFAERREMQRSAAAEKRRSKMKCHLCGLAGHVRRDCPGIADDGRGESKFTNAKGDRGSRSARAHTGRSAPKGKGNKGGAKNRGRKNSRSEDNAAELELPAGFSQAAVLVDLDREEEEVGGGEEEQGAKENAFLYFDASCDSAATIEYLRSGRGKNKLSQKDAVIEYQGAMGDAAVKSNYGGCIVRSRVKPGLPWNAETAYPLEDSLSDRVWFVVGLADDVPCSDDTMDSDADFLVETVSVNSSESLVVGVFCDVDYTAADRNSQARRLTCTLQAASRAGLPIQIRTSSSQPAAGIAAPTEDDSWLTDFLKNAVESNAALKVHLSCWSGGGDRMNTLLRTFPDNLWLGFDGTVSFGKASHLHECAFDVPLSKLLLETGLPSTIPSKISKALGREAFCHSGHIPYIAEALALQKTTSSTGVTAEGVARAATANTLLLYPALADAKF